MKRRRLGRSSLVVSEICLGTMTFGHHADEATSLEILDRAFDAGIDFLDVAENYPVPPHVDHAGRSEEIVGRWLRGRPRDAVVVATKACGPGGGWFPTPVRSGRTGLDRHNLERALEGSLRRLGTDHVDLYQTHWPDRGLPIEHTLEALTRLVESGKVRWVGCSNETSYGLTRSLWASDRGGFTRYETIQNNFSLLNPRFEDELAEVCRREGIGLRAYSPIAGGVLSGKYDAGAWPEGARFTRYGQGDERQQAMTRRFVNPQTIEATRRHAGIAGELGLSPVTFAVAWSLAHDFVGSTIVGATRVEHLEPILAAATVKLPAAALEAVRRVQGEIRYPMG